MRVWLTMSPPTVTSSSPLAVWRPCLRRCAQTPMMPISRHTASNSCQQLLGVRGRFRSLSPLSHLALSLTPHPPSLSPYLPPFSLHHNTPFFVASGIKHCRDAGESAGGRRRVANSRRDGLLSRQQQGLPCCHCRHQDAIHKASTRARVKAKEPQ